MSTRNTFFQKPTVEIDQDRYEELIKAEQKAEQYKQELKRLGEYDYLINIIEATETVDEQVIKEEE